MKIKITILAIALFALTFSLQSHKAEVVKVSPVAKVVKVTTTQPEITTTSTTVRPESVPAVVVPSVPQPVTTTTSFVASADSGVVWTDASGYCVTSSASAVPDGAELGCHPDPKPFYFRNNGDCIITGQAEAHDLNLTYDPTCEQ